MTIQQDAQYILQLLKTNVAEGYVNGEQAMTAWGANTFRGSEASDKYGLSWILFKVATKYEGWVRIALRGLNTAKDEGVFTITLEKFNNVSAEYGTTQAVHNVKSSDLVTVIDSLVETKD